jgi:alkylation response protein AidB-like acyl-CoA dehydrogenase
MDFDLSPELSDLQATVRRLARDKVKPRARDIDRSGAYPTDIFEAFRDAGCSVCASPRSTGARGRGSWA